jgi:hypothetical protein
MHPFGPLEPAICYVVSETDRRRGAAHSELSRGRADKPYGNYSPRSPRTAHD